MDNCIPVYTHGRHANEVKEHEMMLINKPHKIFNSVEEALATIELMSFEEGETRINVDPNGSGRCFVEVFDLQDGEVIGRI